MSRGRPKSVDPTSKMISVRFSAEDLALLHSCRTYEKNGIEIEIPLASLIRQLSVGQAKKLKGGD